MRGRIKTEHPPDTSELFDSICSISRGHIQQMRAQQNKRGSGSDAVPKHFFHDSASFFLLRQAPPALLNTPPPSTHPGLINHNDRPSGVEPPPLPTPTGRNNKGTKEEGARPSRSPTPAALLATLRPLYSSAAGLSSPPLPVLPLRMPASLASLRATRSVV